MTMTGRSKHAKLLSRMQTLNLQALASQRKSFKMPTTSARHQTTLDGGPLPGPAEEAKTHASARDVKAELMAKNFFLEKLSNMN